MGGLFQPYDEYFEDGAGIGNSNVHEGRSDSQPSFVDDDIEHDTASTPGYLHIPHFPHKKMPPSPHRSR